MQTLDSRHDGRYRLYNRRGSGGFVTEAVLTLAEVPFDLVEIASSPNTPLDASFQKTNPWRQVPVLVDPDGNTITETAAILLYLADRHASMTEGPVLWVDNRAAFFRWTVFLATNIYEGTLRRSYPDRYTSHSDNQSLQAVRNAGFARNHAAFQVIEQRLSENSYLCGSSLSATDIFMAMLYAWHNQQTDLPRCTMITHKIASDPKIMPLWSKHFSKRLDFDWTKNL